MTHSARVAALIGVLAATAAGAEPRVVDGLRWHSSLSAARDAAAGTKARRERPVFWLRMLGDLCGNT